MTSWHPIACRCNEQQIREAFRAGVHWAMHQEGYSGPDEPNEDEYVASVLHPENTDHPEVTDKPNYLSMRDGTPVVTP